VSDDLAVTDVDALGRSPLHYAALESDLPAAEALLVAGNDPTVADADGFTPLHFAAQEGAVDVARLLLEHGADVDPHSKLGNTPLFVAVDNSRGPAR